MTAAELGNGLPPIDGDKGKMWTAILAATIQATAPAPVQPVAKLLACQAVRDDTQRLSCYDKAVPAFADAQKGRDIVVLDRAQVTRSKRSLFGFSLPSIKLFGDGDTDEQLKRVTGRLRSADRLPGGLIRFAVEDGDVWETTEETMMPPRAGDTITISAGSLGSYIATAPGRRSVRVRRLR